MRLLMTDATLPSGLPENEQNHYIDLSQMKIANCTGCFHCWVKTPGKCVIRDDAIKVYPIIAASEKVIYVTKLYYGTYDVIMKRMIERSLPIQQAFIRIHHGETHHYQRAIKEKEAVIIAYGEISDKEQQIFKNVVARNAHNMLFREWKVIFVSDEKKDEVILQEVRAWEN